MAVAKDARGIETVCGPIEHRGDGEGADAATRGLRRIDGPCKTKIYGRDLEAVGTYGVAGDCGRLPERRTQDCAEGHYPAGGAAHRGRRSEAPVDPPFASAIGFVVVA